MAARPLRRMLGLLGRRDLPQGEGILLRPAGSIHTFFMRFSIDAVFLNENGVVLCIAAGVRPWRVAVCKRARSVLELAAGESERRGLEVGERLVAA